MNFGGHSRPRRLHAARTRLRGRRRLRSFDRSIDGRPILPAPLPTLGPVNPARLRLWFQRLIGRSRRIVDTRPQRRTRRCRNDRDRHHKTSNLKEFRHQSPRPTARRNRRRTPRDPPLHGYDEATHPLVSVGSIARLDRIVPIRGILTLPRRGRRGIECDHRHKIAAWKAVAVAVDIAPVRSRNAVIGSTVDPKPIRAERRG